MSDVDVLVREMVEGTTVELDDADDKDDEEEAEDEEEEAMAADERDEEEAGRRDECFERTMGVLLAVPGAV